MNRFLRDGIMAGTCLISLSAAGSSLQQDSLGIPEPPLTWKEHWFEHAQLMHRTFYNQSIAVYYDPETADAITWPNSMLTQVWDYTQKIYGVFGDGRLYVLLHTDKYAGGHPATYFDQSHDNRNVIDVGHIGDWESSTGWNLDASVHEIGHIVEGAARGVHRSPAFPLWHDSKWMEIYQYDVYHSLGWEAEANRWLQMQLQQTDDFPRAGTQWFKNWFYPIYTKYGEAKVLGNFFTVLAANFPRNGNAYTRDMNWGEFIHFWSGAAGVNLKQQATLAFGWPDEWEAQFKKAQQDFPGVKYKGR
ncbi:hypothetical protein ACDQ55_19500 [Chitinophaga sp. 30R24]|uniref:hypothetical protein n=1 Tax=Chitinophaga sp. 30R24 TaxID=3248838 RepID=UPI003B90C214